MNDRFQSQVPFIVLAFLIVGHAAQAQGTRSDYERATRLREATANKVSRERVTPHWFAGNSRFWYRNDLPDNTREFVVVDAEAGTRGPAFDHDRLAASLGKVLGKTIEAKRLPIDRLAFDSGLQFSFSCEGRRWRCDLENYEVREAPESEQGGSSLPAGRRVRPSRRTGEETSITFLNRTDGPVDVYWVDAEGQRQRYATLDAGGQHRQHTYAGHVWLVANKAGETLAVFAATEEAGDAVVGKDMIRSAGEAAEPAPTRARGRSPNGVWQAFIKDYNVYIRELVSGQETPLSDDGTEQDAYSEEFHWSPDSQELVVLRIRKGDTRKVYLVESSPKDQLQPKLHEMEYLKPGDRIAVSMPHLFDVAGQRHVPVSDELFPNPWSISDVRWSPDSSRFTFLYNQRGHQALRIVAVAVVTGQVRTLVDEHSSTFIDYAGKQFSRHIDATDEILWMSERDGWNHLYLYDAGTGCVKNQITKGPWVVRGVEHVDEANREIWFQAGGIRPEQDPYYVHLCRVNFDGSGLVILTAGDGTHEVTFSPDRRFFVDRWSRVDHPPVTELRKAGDGCLVCTLERADWTSLLETGWRAPERFAAKGRDGTTDIYGIIVRPSHFDPNRSYPVIEEIYAGPQGAFVPKTFNPLVRHHAIAELGFIVVQIDGMGTSYRSKAFHDVCCKNLCDGGFPDRILWMKAAAAKYPYMDLTRVGVYGGSAGGQNALGALLTHGEFYKVGVADCGCHDNRMDKIWWNELWMGWPVGPHYDEQSNVTLAHRLQGKLLLTVGELDRNVDPSSTMQVVNALIKADKDFDLLIVPGGGHGIGETPYAARRRVDFFVRHLLGVEPRARP